MKFPPAVMFYRVVSRAPQGARGLKFVFLTLSLVTGLSRPARGAWVEIHIRINKPLISTSRPARGAWVEIKKTGNKYDFIQVAPRKGRVG